MKNIARPESIKHSVRHCCHCGKIAEWVIWYHKEDPEDFTDVCSKHLAQYLPRNLGVLVCPQ